MDLEEDNSDIMSPPSFLENSSSYMSNLFIEVLKIVGIRGYNTLEYQRYLDITRDNDFYLKRGEIHKVIELKDDYMGRELSQKFISMTGLNIEPISSRGQFTSVFLNKTGIIVIFFGENNTKSQTIGIGVINNFIEILTAISRRFFGTPNYCSVNMKSILITKTNLSSAARTHLDPIQCIEHFLDTNFLSSVPENVFCSRRTVLSASEKEIIEEDYKLSKFPYIPKVKDISYQLYGINKNDVVRELRTSLFPEAINQKSISYRVCK